MDINNVAPRPQQIVNRNGEIRSSGEQLCNLPNQTTDQMNFMIHKPTTAPCIFSQQNNKIQFE